MNTTTTEAIQEEEPFIPYADPAQAPDYLKKLLDPYMERMGFLPNALKLYIHRPEIAEILWQLNNRVMRDPSSTLDQRLKRELGSVASKLNKCKYCTSHHTAILQNPANQAMEGWGMGDDEVQALLGGEWKPANAMERACFEFVIEATTDSGKVSEETYEELKKNLTPEQIIELAAVVGFWKMYNTIHQSLRVPLEARLFEVAKKTGL
ncbi:MAG: carboxymuconolactone decarboxylase family protein [Gammaproteobacteria bacterium]